MKNYLAIDIGASSGRAIVSYIEHGEQKLDEVYRFPNNVTECDGHLVWDIPSLFTNIKEGIRHAFAKYGELESLSIDTWGVDYCVLYGEKSAERVFAYRDSRTAKTIPLVHEKMPFSSLFEKTGIMFNSFNTIYQLYDDLLTGKLEGATDFLMLPEYFSYLLTGVKKKEYTNATTTGLVNANARTFDLDIVDALGLPRALFETPLCAPGTSLGALLPEIAQEVGGTTEVILCASHDTASAVEGIPMDTKAPYISSGTWSLLGVKVPAPITNKEALAVNFSNEGGVGYIRFQKNIMGLWIVQSLRRELCPEKDFGTIAQEARTSTFSGTFDVNDESFLAPKSMKEAIDNAFTFGERPVRECDYFFAAFRSLALSYRDAIRELEGLTGEKYDALYIVGGGAKNTLLNELTEEAIGFRVVALPIEATALGNLKIQMNRK
ncbi:MAG: rhamnulokinase [Clostridia bacterium]|nr:rhamnulokinase [Clostridia bacterium]